MLDFVENKGIAHSASAYHKAVNACFLKHTDCIGGGKNITVADNRNGNCFLYRFYVFPVGTRLIHLLPCAPVHANSGGSVGFSYFGNFHTVDRVKIPTCANFNSDRHLARIYNLFDNFATQGGVFEQGTAVTRGDNFAHRTAHININYIWNVVIFAMLIGGGGEKICAFRHHLWVRAENLYA